MSLKKKGGLYLLKENVMLIYSKALQCQEQNRNQNSLSLSSQLPNSNLASQWLAEHYMA